MANKICTSFRNFPFNGRKFNRHFIQSSKKRKSFPRLNLESTFFHCRSFFSFFFWVSKEKNINVNKSIKKKHSKLNDKQVNL